MVGKKKKIRMFQKLRKREEFATNIKIRKPELILNQKSKDKSDRHWWVKSNGKQKSNSPLPTQILFSKEKLKRKR